MISHLLHVLWCQINSFQCYYCVSFYYVILGTVPTSDMHSAVHEISLSLWNLNVLYRQYKNKSLPLDLKWVQTSLYPHQMLSSCKDFHIWFSMHLLLKFLWQWIWRSGYNVMLCSLVVDGYQCLIRLHEDRDSRFLWNTDNHLPNYTSHPTGL